MVSLWWVSSCLLWTQRVVLGSPSELSVMCFMVRKIYYSVGWHSVVTNMWYTLPWWRPNSCLDIPLPPSIGRVSRHSLIVRPVTGWNCPRKRLSWSHTIWRPGIRGTSSHWKYSSSHGSSVSVPGSHEVGVLVPGVMTLDYIRFLFCQLFGPVNHRQNWKVGREVVKKFDYQW